jgi:hypothetical protein
MDKFTIVENLAHFLLERTGSVLKRWSGRLTAAEQRKLFGTFIGKGKLVIDGAHETIAHLVKVPHWYGDDANETYYSKWSEIN